jgi:uncharacterized protein YgiM (DUF1202 family)
VGLLGIRSWRSARQRCLRVFVVAGLALSIAAPSWATTRAQVDDLGGRTASIARSEDGVNLRAEPGFAGEVIAVLSDGTVVDLRIDVADTVLDGDGETRWWPVRVEGQDGWVAGYYLDETGTASADEPSSTQDESTAREVPSDAASGAITGTTATASVTSPDGANFRAEAGVDGEVLRVLAFGSVVELRVDEADTVVHGGVRWWPVRVAGQDGWVAGDYLQDDFGVVADGDSPEPATDTSSSVVYSIGQYVAALTDTGDGLNIRVEVGIESERVGFVREGDIVQVMDGPFAADGSGNGWYLITDGAVTGYVDGDYLTGATQPAAPSDDADPVQDVTSFDQVFFTSGDYVAAGDGGVNVRSGASLQAGVLRTLSTGDVVEVIGGPEYDADGGGWYLVTDGVSTGYANGNYLLSSPAPPPPPAPIAGVATGSFIIPVASYTFTQAYGCSPFVFEPYDANLGCNFHNGIDLANGAGTALLAADGGVVKYAGWCDCGLGFYVEIDHGNGFSTVYGHMNGEAYVATGEPVTQGQVIGPMGSTGLSTGPHVHFMVKVNGSTVDPLLYLPPV